MFWQAAYFKALPLTTLLIMTCVKNVDAFTMRSLANYRCEKCSLSYKRSAHPFRVSTLRLSDLSVSVYDAQLQASNFIQSELVSSSAATLVVLYVVGLFSALSPCALGMMPLTSAYLGVKSADSENSHQIEGLGMAACYSIGLSIVLSFLGIIAAQFGEIFGTSNIFSEFGSLPNLLVGVVYVLMGLNILGIVRLEFPSIKMPWPSAYIRSSSARGYVEALLFGATSALIATPCTSPVLAALLTYVSTSTTPVYGGLFLFIFGLGYATPIAGAGIASAAATNAIMASGSPWVVNAFASVLITYGSYEFLVASASAFT